MREERRKGGREKRRWRKRKTGMILCSIC